MYSWLLKNLKINLSIKHFNDAFRVVLAMFSQGEIHFLSRQSLNRINKKEVFHRTFCMSSNHRVNFIIAAIFVYIQSIEEEMCVLYAMNVLIGSIVEVFLLLVNFQAISQRIAGYLQRSGTWGLNSSISKIRKKEVTRKKKRSRIGFFAKYADGYKMQYLAVGQVTSSSMHGSMRTQRTLFRKMNYRKFLRPLRNMRKILEKASAQTTSTEFCLSLMNGMFYIDWKSEISHCYHKSSSLFNKFHFKTNSQVIGIPEFFSFHQTDYSEWGAKTGSSKGWSCSFSTTWKRIASQCHIKDREEKKRNHNCRNT